MATIVQSAQAVEATGPATVVTMGSNVTAGNVLVVMIAHVGGDNTSITSFSDTQSSTFTKRASGINVSGGQSTCYIYTAPITSSGPEVITRTAIAGNYPASMIVAEVSGILSGFTIDDTDNGFSDAVPDVTTGSVTSANPTLMLVGSGGASVDAFDIFTPTAASGATTYTAGHNGALIKFVAAGTYSVTFSKTSAAGGRNSACVALISFGAGDVTESLSDTISLTEQAGQGRGYLFPDTISLSDAALNNNPFNQLEGDFLNIKDTAVATFGFFPPGGQRGNIDYDQIRLSARAGTGAKLHTLTGSLTLGHTVVVDANGNLIDAGAAPGTGTVSSVAMTVPAGFTIGGSPVTTTGTLALGLSNENANLVWAGPTTGSAATPAFRAIVEADLPLGSSSAFGAVKVDNTTITAAAGVISAVAPGLVLLEQHTASNSASLDFTTCITSSYDEYVIELVNIIPASNAVNILIRASTNGGSSYDSGSNYWTDGLSWRSGAATAVGGGSGTSMNLTIANGLTMGNDSKYGASFSLRLYSPLSTALYKQVIGKGFIIYNDNAIRVMLEFGGQYTSTTAMNAFQVLASSGNIASGTVRVYGLKK